MAATPISNEALAEAAEAVGQTSWGLGAGLNGDVFAPSDIDSLVDLLGTIEFKAEINSEDYIRYSNLDAGGFFFDDDSISNGLEHPTNRLRINGWANSGDDWNGQSIQQSNGSTVIEYAEESKNTWGQRDFVRNLFQAVQNEDFNSGYVFLQPDNFRAEGLIGGHGAELRRDNPNHSEGSYFSELVENAPVVIDISSDLATELSAIAASAISFSQEDFKALTTDFEIRAISLSESQTTWTPMARSIHSRSILMFD